MNGFYPMLNEVHDKAVAELPLAECALFEHIWRKLIGWNQFEDQISIGQLVKETSGSRATILRLLKDLEEKRWIRISRNVNGGLRGTNIISIPTCPGIIMRLGWYHFDTTPGVKMIPGVVSNRDQGWCQNDTHNRQFLQTSLKDNLKENNNNVPLPPENEDEERFDKICAALKKAIGGDANSITLVSNSYQHEAFNAIMEYPDEKILTVIRVSGEKGKIHQDNAVTYVKNGLERYDTWYSGTLPGNGATGSIGDIRRAREAEELASCREYLASLEIQRLKHTGRQREDVDGYIASCKADIARLEAENEL